MQACRACSTAATLLSRIVFYNKFLIFLINQLQNLLTADVTVSVSRGMPRAG